MSKRYSAQFKQEALNFVQTHPSLGIATVAKQLGVGTPLWITGYVNIGTASALRLPLCSTLISSAFAN